MSSTSITVVKCDVLVVGASPAGLMAAISAANGGASVILLDRDLAGLNHVANTLFEGMAIASGIKVEDCFLKKELEGMRIISPSGQGVAIPAKGYFIDRKKFDEHYLRLAQSCGVSLLAAVAKKSRLEGIRRIVCLDEGEIDAKVVVDASGVLSGLARERAWSPCAMPRILPGPWKLMSSILAWARRCSFSTGSAAWHPAGRPPSRLQVAIAQH